MGVLSPALRQPQPGRAGRVVADAAGPAPPGRDGAADAACPPRHRERRDRPAALTDENSFTGLLNRYGRSSLAFVREVLGMEPDPWQVEVCTAIDQGETRISIRSGHG